MTQQSHTPQRAARLPAHIPGQVITVTLKQLPAYLLANGLRLMDLGEVRTYQQDHRSHPADVFLVKRTGGEEDGAR